MRFFRNATKNTGRNSRVSSGTRPKIPGDTRAFLQERAEKFRETLVRFFRNATKNTGRHSCVSSGTQLKIPGDTKNSARHSCVSSGTRPKIQRTAIAFLERTRPKNSVKHVRVSSNDASKNSSILEINIFEKRYLPEKKFKLVVYFIPLKVSC